MRNKTVELPFVIPGASTKSRSIGGSIHLAKPILVFYWNSTVTQVKKLIRYSIQSILALQLVFEHGFDKKLIKDLSSQSACFLLSSLSFSQMLRVDHSVEVITIQHSKCSFSHLFLFFCELNLIFCMSVFIHNHDNVIDIIHLFFEM